MRAAEEIRTAAGTTIYSLPAGTYTSDEVSLILAYVYGKDPRNSEALDILEEVR